MSGVTKHIYESDIADINKMWNSQIKSIKNALPQDYSEEDVLNIVKKYYPYEWKGVDYKKIYYDKKDKAIQKKFGKKRYKMPPTEKLFLSNGTLKSICRKSEIERYNKFFDEQARLDNENTICKKREPKIRKIDEKINKAKAKTQSVTPAFLDQLIGFYERKNTSQKDKVYILNELMKYYNAKVISFFFKINDIELNKQLREMAFYHLQSFNFQPRLRRQKYMLVHTKNKKRKEYLKKIYPFEKYDISKNPKELEYRINNGKEQSIKKYDYFISHSSKDSKSVQKLIDFENSKGKYVFCDWINDADYLKRELVCNETLKVIEHRLEKSDAIIFVKSENSLKSIWCNYELNFFRELNRKIYFINIEDIEEHKFELLDYAEEEYLNLEYQHLSLV